MDFIHRWIPATGGETVLLLHGTGGDQNDLLPVGRMVAPGAAFLSPRGQVLERGMPRFFKRFAEGVFDLEDLRARTHELADWIDWASREYQFDKANLVALGYSNGANIAASLLLLRPESMGHAVLLRAMLPFEPDQMPDLGAKRILMANGKQDPIIPLASASRLAAVFQAAGAEVTIRLSEAGHGLERGELDEAQDWYQDLLGKSLR